MRVVQDVNLRSLQANMGFSVKCDTIRELHYELAPAPKVKLVRRTRLDL